jgi:hypothetical protein
MRYTEVICDICEKNGEKQEFGTLQLNDSKAFVNFDLCIDCTEKLRTGFLEVAYKRLVK